MQTFIDSILIGNSFPLSLIRRKVEIIPADLADLQKLVKQCRVVSFWGHANTMAAAGMVLGADLTPPEPRPVLTLNDELLPQLAGQTFTECYIVSPEYRQNFRPAIGEEVAVEKISGWQILKIIWR